MGSGGTEPNDGRESVSVEALSKQSTKEIKLRADIKLQSIITLTVVGLVSGIIMLYFIFAMYCLAWQKRAVDDVIKVGDQFLGKLLPILTLLLGYIFGSRREGGGLAYVRKARAAVAAGVAGLIV